MPKFSRLVGGFPLHVFLVLLSFYKLSSLILTLLLLVLDPNHERTCGRTKAPPPILAVAIAYFFFSLLILVKLCPTVTSPPRLQQYGVIHQVGW